MKLTYRVSCTEQPLWRAKRREFRLVSDSSSISMLARPTLANSFIHSTSDSSRVCFYINLLDISEEGLTPKE